MQSGRRVQGIATVLGLVALAAAGCGGDDDESERRQPARAASAERPVQDPATLPPARTDEEAIARTIKTFYLASARDDGPTACRQFSKQGRAGFLRGAQRNFPGLITSDTACEDAVHVFQVGLESTIDDLKSKGVPVGLGAIKDLRVKQVEVRGDRATALAPVGIGLVIKPKRMQLAKVGDEWKIAGSRNPRRKES